ncbi:hypothetical protein EVAR_8317_1 [Eumeta japonica]|uniref:Uncharacterized protein n=1 Tax=Eumeta variegata TaxID=151549 RepID=A0A4C1VEV8_EUMVA|nr:hypothetical protein EVAR_8317_1 [Eumeta japonica]
MPTRVNAATSRKDRHDNRGTRKRHFAFENLRKSQPVAYQRFKSSHFFIALSRDKRACEPPEGADLHGAWDTIHPPAPPAPPAPPHGR